MAAILGSASVAAALPTDASFSVLVDPDAGYYASIAWAVSNDGRVVVGGLSDDSSVEAFRWTEEGGFELLGQIPGGRSFSDARAVDGDGSLIVGDASLWGLNDRSFAWTSDTGLVVLEVEGDFIRDNELHANGASDDGAIVVGAAVNTAMTRVAFRRSGSQGMIPLSGMPIDRQSSALDASFEGSVIVGSFRNADDQNKAFRWTESTGPVGLGDLPGGEVSSVAVDVSPDGRWLVGNAVTEAGLQCFVWNAAHGKTGIGVIPGPSESSIAAGVSNNGRVVGGTASTSGGRGAAVIWTPQGGMKRLQDVLNALGVSTDPIDLDNLEGISGDGATFVGFGRTADDIANGFVAALPEACSIADMTHADAPDGSILFGVPDGMVSGADLLLYVNVWLAADLLAADLTTQNAGVGDPNYGVPDGLVTGADIQYFVNFWVAGCP